MIYYVIKQRYVLLWIASTNYDFRDVAFKKKIGFLLVVLFILVSIIGFI